MPLDNPRPIYDVTLTGYLPTGGTSTGVRASLAIPIRGKILECGFAPNSATSDTTLTVVKYTALTATTVGSVQVVSSTLGTFNSVNLIEGLVNLLWANV